MLHEFDILKRYLTMGKAILLFALVVLAATADPKKGAGCEGGCNDGTLRNLQVSWYYNWGVKQNFTTSIEFVPMCFSLHRIPDLPNYSSHLLGFNEPDNAKQSNIPARDAASAWPELVKKSYTIASPVMAGDPTPNDSWLVTFFKALATVKVDHIAVHHYGKNMTRLKQLLTQIHNHPTFGGRPIWLTEFAAQTNEQSTTNPLPQNEVTQYLNEAVAWLKSTDFVHRYAWHSAKSGTSALWDDAGQLTETGKRYAYA